MPIIEGRVANVEDLKDGEMKEFTLHGHRVLLSQVNGQIFATSPKCTHYGAPLATGVLTSDGRITCPWHGACFKVSTGDIEDAPALDSLNKYEVRIKNGEIFVIAEEAALKAGRRKPTRNLLSKDENKTVVILGGGASGSTTAENLRDQGFVGRIVVVSRESYYPIDRPQLSKKLDIGDPVNIKLRDATFWEELGVEFLLSTSAQSVNTKSKTVTLSSGSQLNYDSLVLATGSYARTIPIPGIDLNNVFTLRTVDNANAIFQATKALGGKPNVIIIGSSFIGMEIASTFSKILKTAETEPAGTITVIGIGEVPFQRILGKQIGKALMDLHTNQNVQFRMQAEIKSLRAGVEGKVASIQLASGEELPADIVIVGAGVAPQTDYLKGNDAFELQRDGGLKVDSNFRVEGHQDVYAAGDIARFHWDLTNEDLRIEHWSHAENTGRFVALNIVGKNKTFTSIPYFWTAQQGKSIRYAGYASSYDDIIIQGSVEEMSFAAFYVRGEKVISVLSINKDPIVSHSAELLRSNKYPTATELRNGKNVLDIKI